MYSVLMSPWVHVTSSYLGQWLPGDKRGFRNRKHRIHSNGYYKLVGGVEDHEGLRRHAEDLSSGKILLKKRQRRELVEAMATKFREMEISAGILSCSATHCHALIKVG